MHWIESISRTPAGRLELVGRNLDGHVKHFSPSQFPHQLPGSHTKLRVSLSSDAHRVTPVDDYLALKGWKHLSGSAQRLHRFQMDSLEIWIPSQVLFKMLFSTMRRTYDAIFSGRGLHEVAMPSHSEDPMALLPGLTHSNDGWAHAVRMRERLFWLLTSASAARSWRHVFRNAIDGVLDAPLPDGVFELRLTGNRLDGVFLATRATLAGVTCSDLRLRDGTLLEPMQLDFQGQDHSKRQTDKGQRVERLDDASPWCLTDEQFHLLLDWMFQNKLLQDRGSYDEHLQHTLRRHLVLLRAKFLGRCVWGALPCSPQERACVQARFYKLRRAGQWERFSEVLLNERLS